MCPTTMECVHYHHISANLIPLQPITDVTSNDVICNGGINPYHQPMSTVIISAKAGDTITAEWHHSLAGADPSDPADPIDSSHKGPVMAYLSVVY